MELKTIYKDTAITKVDGLIDTEHTAARCFDHLAVLIRNGRVRKQLAGFSTVAKKNQDWFLTVLKQLGAPESTFEERCSLCKIEPASFSLNGTLNLGIEITDIAIRYYEDLIALCDDQVDKKVLRRMLKEKSGQRDLLKKERRFEHSDADGAAGGESYCNPEVVSQLYK